MFNQIQILDCTLRDGGYYNDWDFSDSLTNQYFFHIKDLPIHYVEIGYRNPQFAKNYLGQYFHLSVEKIIEIKNKLGKAKLAIMLDSKSISKPDIANILDPIIGIVDLIRIAVNPLDLDKSIELAHEIKKRKFELALNFMYMSKHPLTADIIEKATANNLEPDFIYLVDSYGGATPELVEEQVALLKSHYSGKIGFHGHNNLEMALINSISAIKKGVSIVDSTILGMGRGAGNLKTELLLAYLVGTQNITCNLKKVAKLTNEFKPLHNTYNWGTNLPYMIAGSLNFPQAKIMSWLVSDRYSEDDIVSKVFNSSRDFSKEFKKIEQSKSTDGSILILGGGKSVSYNANKIEKYIKSKPDIKVYCTSLKHIARLENILHLITFCLSGQQLRNIANEDNTLISKINRIVLAPSPRNIEVSIPSYDESKIYELPSLHYSDKTEDSPLIIALELATIEQGNVEILGFDGYSISSDKGIFLNALNNQIFQSYRTQGLYIASLTKTIYALESSPSIHAKTMFI